MKKALIALAMLLFPLAKIVAEDGSRLWLRQAEQPNKARITADRKSETVNIAINELKTYWAGLPIALKHDKAMADDEGFAISKGKGSITLSAHSDAGLLYGAYELLRLQATGQEVGGKSSRPTFKMRMLNHWDNLDLSVERGYAGLSIWKWSQIDGDRKTLSRAMRQRLAAYARANASIGINATVLNNVNASPDMLSAEYIKKASVIADALRPYNIKVWLSVNFASPKALGGLPTADPLDQRVKAWWKAKADELYRAIPDFGGFLVKANSEGQPGPGDYGRTHADGANTLADALKPHGGTVVWRCFVYGNHKGEDRVKQAVTEFKPIDGQFRDNVALQAKNGPLDFQPREPYSPIFDQIKHTPLMAELQITQEYLGQSIHLAYLAPMWKEFFAFVNPGQLRGVAGVANIGDDANWCGHHFSQANWYAFGRLAWDASLPSEQIAKEWLEQTFTSDPAFVGPMAKVMETSREACVDYMMPLGLHHIFKADHHYGPEPDGNQPHFPMEWKPVYYHKADSTGIGFDRTTSGSDAVSQYREPFCTLYNDLKTCPDEYLLWFHHVAWTYRMRNGKTLWQNLCLHYNRGVETAGSYVSTWKAMKPYVDGQRYGEVMARLNAQLANAKEWRDTCLGYFGKLAGMPIIKSQPEEPGSGQRN